MDYILKTFGLVKKYKKQLAVNEADMTICRGDIYGFVGENGSGKTTIIRLITGLVFPDSGRFELFGVPHDSIGIQTARRKVGAVVESPSIYPNMSAYDNLKMQCMILGIPADNKISETLNEVGLGYLLKDKKQAGDFSLGMRQRLGIAMTLLGDPEFLILDEPMNGLDPAGIVEIRELILKLNRERKITFLISSHILSELSLVATKYGIISRGHIIKEITAAQLQVELAKTTDITVEQPERLISLFDGLLPETSISYILGGIRITGEIDLNTVLSTIIKEEIRIISVNCHESSFEDYYLKTIGGKRS
ncbi:MAG: ATP-binding cassette domain-containing protein [Ruminococcaceae bacterium]|nr:ATP-binding cassette domain-containing protein [Oscillospiraceae bacterium]